MKKIIITLSLLLIALSAVSYSQQAGDDSVFVGQSPLTEKDMKGFIGSSTIPHYLTEAEERGIDHDTVNSHVKKETTLSVTRYTYVLTKLLVCHTVIYQGNLTNKEIDETFSQYPSYMKPNNAEKALIEKYKKEIGDTITAMDL